MDYIDYSSFPTLASADCSPTAEEFSYRAAFNKGFMADPFAGSDTSFNAFDVYFTRPISSTDAAKSLDATSSAAPTTGSQLKSTSNPAFARPPFGQFDVYSSGLPFDTNPIANTSAFDSNSLIYDASRTHSLCGDAPQNSVPLSSPPLSPRSQLRRESTDSVLSFEDCQDPANPPKRKRGRPRLDRSTSSLSSSCSATAQRSQRLPHYQVERKYRKGLNASLERLRKTVPTLCQDDKLGSLLSHAKPSKAMILEGAIEYIKDIERERDVYRSELERLRRMSGDGGGGGGGGGWENRAARRT